MKTCVISQSFPAQTPSVHFTKAAPFMPIEAQACMLCVGALIPHENLRHLTFIFCSNALCALHKGSTLHAD